MTYYIGNNLFDEFETCTLQECVDYLSGQEVIGLDIETGRKFPKGTYREDVYKPGLDPRVSRILMVQVGTLEKRFVIDARVVDVSPLLPMLESESVIKVGANLAFESLHFRHNFGINIRNLYDVLLVDRVLTNGLYTSYSLEALLKRYRNYESRTTMDLFGQRSMESEVKKLFEARVDDYIFSHGFITEEVEEELLIEVTEEIEDRYVDKSIRLEFVEWGDKPFRKEHIWYGEKDITEPLLLRDIFLKGRIIEYDSTREVYNPLNAIKMENRLIEPLSEMMHQGVCLDPLQWKEIAQEKKRLYYEKIEWLNNWVVDNHPEFGGAIDMFTNKATCMVKWSSPKQVQKLFHKLGLTVRARSKFTGKVEDTVGAKELLKALPNEYKAKFFESKFPDDIVEGKDLVLAYLLVKKLQQLHTTYGEQFLNYLHPITGRIHCNIRQYLHTSRMAAVRPNMLAVPRGKEYRGCFIAPKGMKVWACDYSSWIGMITVHRECTTIIII